MSISKENLLEMGFKVSDDFRESLPLDTPSGTKIKFDGKGGYAFEKEAAQKILEIGKIYTLKRMVLGDWSSTLTVEGFDKSFNTCLFCIPLGAEECE